jgi:hypothetical protein
MVVVCIYGHDMKLIPVIRSSLLSDSMETRPRLMLSTSKSCQIQRHTEYN